MAQLVNVFSLLMLIFFIFAVLGNFLFPGVKEGQVIDEYNNFWNFGMAILLLMRIATGEEWD